MRFIIYPVRVTVLLLMALLWLILGLIVCIFRPMHRSNVYALTQMLTLAQRVIGVKVTLDFDPASVRPDMPAIFVGLHQSNWDIVTMAHLPQPGLVCVGKKSLLYAPIFGILFFLSGNVLLDREKRSKAGDTFLKIVEKIKTRNLSIWMFPEGTRSGYGPVGSYKSGALHTAMLAKVKVIPFVTSTYAGQIDLGRWDNGEVRIRMLPALDGSTLTRPDIARATRKLRTDMVAALKELDPLVRRPQGYQLPADRYDSPRAAAPAGAAAAASAVPAATANPTATTAAAASPTADSRKQDTILQEQPQPVPVVAETDPVQNDSNNKQ